MAAVTIRNIPEETHRALKQRAASHGNSTEAEIRLIIEQAVRPASRLKLGTFLTELGRKNGPLELQPRDRSPVRPAEFE